MRCLFVWFNYDGYITAIQKQVLEAFTELQIEHEVCYWEDYPEAVKKYDPIITLFFHPNKQIYNLVDIIKQTGGHKLLWDMESPYESDIVFDMLPYIHYMFISDNATVKEIKKLGVSNQVFYVPHACNPKIHKPIPPEDIPYEYKSDYVLVGNAYESRIKFLNENRDMFKDKILTVVGIGYWGLEGFKNQNFVRRHVSTEECVLYYNGADVVLNPHRTNDDLDMANTREIAPEHLNNRFYEVAAIGKQQIVSGRDNMKEEIAKVMKQKPEEYSYTARLREFFIPLLK